MKYILRLLSLSLFTLLTGCATLPPSDANWPATIEINSDIKLTRLADGVWLHTTWYDYPGSGRGAANGLLIIDGRHLALIDTPATDTQTAQLLDWAEQHANARLDLVVPTHFHNDCMGGLAEAHRRGARSWSQTLTQQIAREQNLPIPQNGFESVKKLRCGAIHLELFYPGPGHTRDNITVWLDQSKILFGGCLIKAANTRSQGNTADADTTAWPRSVQTLIDRYPVVENIIPGHGQPGNISLLPHTQSLFNPQ